MRLTLQVDIVIDARSNSEADMTNETAGPSLRTIVAASSGNALEWYDFTVYSFLAPILGRAFFPSDDPTVSLLASFAVLAVGYLARPLGSLVFGNIGDTLGRKRALLLSIVIMGVASICLGLLPTYEEIGVAAAVLLVLIRVVQGISVAGEFTASGILLAEAAAPGRRCLTAAWVPAAMLAGCMLGSGVPALVGTLVGQEALAAWGWRIPFLCGGVIALFTLVLRSTMPETLAATPPARGEAAPVWRAVRSHLRDILRMVVLLIPAAVLYFAIFVYATSFWTGELAISTTDALDVSTVNLALLAAAMLLCASLADRFGVRRVLMAGALYTLLAALPLWHLMHRPSLELVALGQLGLALGLAAYYGLCIIVLVDMIPARVRCSVVSIGYNGAMAAFGGTTPLIATWLTRETGHTDAPIAYVMATVALSLAVIWSLPRGRTAHPA